nr:hypothetical protein [Tanacetum cinerariifolium]
EAVHEELGDSLVRAATTASSLRVEQDSSNINKTQSKATPNESSSQGTNLGGGLGVQDDADKEMFDVDTLNGEEVFVAEQEVVEDVNDEVNVVEEVVEVFNTAKLIIDIAQVSAARDIVSTASAATTVSAATTTTATITTVDDVTLAQALKEIKSKGMLIKPVKPKKRKDQIRLDEEAALELQAEFDEKERLAREKAKKEQEVNIALIETWDDIQAEIDVDHQLAKRMQAQEQEKLSIKEKAILFQQLLEKRRKHFAAKRA